MHLVRAVGVRCLRRVLHGLHDVAGDPAAVEAVGVVADALVGPRQVGVALDGADRLRRLSVEVELARRGEVVEDARVGRDLAIEGRIDDEALACDPLAGPQKRAQGARAVALERLLPAGHGARDADAEPAHVGLGELAGLLVGDERVLIHVGRRRLARVDGVDPAVLGVVDDHEAAAADAARERLGDAEHAGRRDRGVDRVAAGAEDVDRRLRGERVDRGGGAAGADRGRCLGWLWHRPCLGLRPRHRSARGRERGDERHQHCKNGKTGDTRHETTPHRFGKSPTPQPARSRGGVRGGRGGDRRGR